MVSYNLVIYNELLDRERDNLIVKKILVLCPDNSILDCGDIFDIEYDDMNTQVRRSLNSRGVFAKIH